MSDYKVTNLVGTPTDYSDRNNWAYLPENTDKEADTFFIYPTVYVNTEPGAPAIVPVEDEMLRAGVKVFFAQGTQAFVDLTNLYMPYYRLYTAYWENIRENIQTRTKAYSMQHRSAE